ncbi:1025_t:CDS:10, partial [Cetraspora pellucida]
ILKTLEQSRFLSDYLSQINVADHNASHDEMEIPSCIGFSTRKIETRFINQDLITRTIEFDKLMAKIDNIEHVLRQNIITIKDEMSTIGSSLTDEVQNSCGGNHIDDKKDIFREEISKLIPKLIQDINLKHEESTKSLEQSLSAQVEELKREFTIHQQMLEHVLENQKIANCQQCLSAPTGGTGSTGSLLSTKMETKRYNTIVKQEEIEYSMNKSPTRSINTRIEQVLDSKLHVKEANKIGEQEFTFQEPSFDRRGIMTQSRNSPSIHTLKKSEQRYVLRQNNTKAAHLSITNSEQSSQSDSTNCPPITKLSGTSKIKRKLIIDVDLEQEIKEALSNRSVFMIQEKANQERTNGLNFYTVVAIRKNPTETTEIVEEDKKEVVTTTKIVEEEPVDKENGTNVPETPEPIYKGHLNKHHKYFGKNQRHFELNEDPIPKDNLNPYYKKNIKDVPKKAPPTKPSAEPEKPSAEPEKPSSEPEKQTDVPASDTPASDVPASDVPASDAPVSKDEKEEQKEKKEQKESDQFDKIHFCNIAHAIQTGKGLLFYYKNEKNLEKRIPWGIINLKGATVEVDKTSSNKFRITTKAGKEHILEAYSEKEKSSWVYTINEEIKKAEDIDAIYASDEYKNIYDQLVNGQFKFAAKEGITSDSEPLSDSDEKQGRPDKHPQKISVNTDGVNTADVSPDDGATKSPKSSKNSFFNFFGVKKDKVEAKDESAKDKEIPQETKDAKDVGSNDTPAPGEDTIVTDTKGTDEPKDDTKEEIKEDVKEEIKEDVKEETKEEKKKGTLLDIAINAITSNFKTTKEEKTTTSEVEAVEKPEATEPVPEEQTTGAEPSKDEESQTPDKPKEEPTKIMANLSRRITSVFKKKPEKAPFFNYKKYNNHFFLFSDNRLSIQKKRSGSQSEEKQESEVVQDEFEIIHAEVMKEYPNCAKQGKLHKETFHSIFKREEPRYFAFHGGILYYFKDSKTKKQIKIEKNCSVKKADNKRFEIETPSRTYKFQAPSEEEQTEWVKVIEDHISSLPEESPSDKKELPEVTNVTNSEEIQAAVDEAAKASKESTDPSTDPKTEPKTESDVAEKSEITPAAPATTATA